MSEPTDMELVVGVDGGVRCIYDEALDLRALGKLQITRASHVEPDTEGMWWADMGPVGGPMLGPCARRLEALQGRWGGWWGGRQRHNNYHGRKHMTAATGVPGKQLTQTPS